MSDTLSIQSFNGKEMLVWKNEHTGKVFDPSVHVPLVEMIGARVVPGPDWKWGEQGGRFPVGIVLGPNEDGEGWLRVRWRNGDEHSYRWGADGAYDLKVKPRNFFYRLFNR